MKVPARVALPAARTAVRLRGVRPGFPWTAPHTPAGVEPLPQRKRTGAAFDTEWARNPPARFVRSLIVEGPLRGAVKAVADPERRGLDRLADLDGDRPLIFASNHHSHLDAPLMITAIPQPWRGKLVVGAAADYFFGTRTTGTLSALALGAFPIDRTKVNRRSADVASDLVGDGWSLLIFPEGGRSPDGWGQPFRGGAAYLAIKTGTPVVPVHLEGTGNLWAKGRSLPRRGLTTVTFGRPLSPAPGDDARRFGTTIERAVAQLADEQATDWWSARRRAAAGATPVLTGPDGPSWRRRWALGARDPRRRRSPSWPDLR